MKYTVEAPDYPISDVDEWASVHNEKFIIFYRTVVDTDPPNPMKDWDSQGKIVSFNSRHLNFQHPNNFYDDDGNFAPPENAVVLSYFEHGRCKWMVAGEPAPAGVEFQWDGRRVAGLWIPDKGVMDNIHYSGKLEGAELRAALIEYATGVVETYTDWCNGDVFGYEVEKFVLARDEDGDVITDYDEYDCRHQEPVYEDSCYGFYGYNDLTKDLQSIVAAELQEV